jgi:iron(III) transport system substrate-binding protein
MRRVSALLTALLLSQAAWGQASDSQRKWDDVVDAAKREGKVVVVGSPDPVMRKVVIPSFTAKYGIDVSYIAGGSGDLAGKIRTERMSGIYSVDVYMAGNDTTVNVLYREKMIDPIRPLMTRQETIDPSKWKTGKLWFVDPEDKYILRMYNTVTDVFLVNSDQVKPEDLRSVDDLLSPRWKGKISTQDPTVSGTGGNSAGRFYNDNGAEFVKKLYIDQKPLISRDRRLLADALARGTYPICLTCRPDDVQDLIKAGYKITDIFELEGIRTRIRPGSFLLTYANKAPHPNAAQVFVNWMAGKEGVDIYSRIYGEASLRTDIDESMLDPRIIPKPGATYPDEGDFHWVTTGRREASEAVRILLK